MDAETVVVVNPNSAGGATGRKWPQLAQQLTQKLGDVEVLSPMRRMQRPR